MLQEQKTLPIKAVVRNVNGERYIIEGLLGKGGSGAVYLVREKGKDTLFALKEMIDPDRQERARFAFEAEVLRQLEHPALPKVYRVFEYEKLKRVFILMDYIEGSDLEALRQEEPKQCFPLPLALALLDPIVKALNYLHHCEPPIVHRDIKPANIIVPIKRGESMLVDFGIAKMHVNDATTTIIRRGSPGYAALEQYGSGTSTLTDVYGLGATLYALLTGEVPVDALTRASAGKGTDPLKPAHELVPTVSIGVSEAIQRAMAVSQEERFGSIDEFWKEIQAQVGKETSEEEEETIPRLPSIRLQSPKKVLPQEHKRVTTAFLPSLRAAIYPRRYMLLSLLCLWLVILVIGTGLLFTLHHAPRNSMPIGIRSTTRATATPSTRTTRTSTPNISDYPAIATSYMGTANDILHNAKTDMSLTNVQQNGGHIQGTFRGLGVVGPFTGTVDKAEHVLFNVVIYGGDATFAFEGVIKIGSGAMAGSFAVLDRSGQRTGEYGEWSVEPAA